MHKIALAVVLFGVSIVAFGADQSVGGYTRSNGTYVEPYHRSAPNDTKLDNYSTRGNTNPYTGQSGTRDPYPSTYQAPRPPSNPSANDGFKPYNPYAR